MHEYMDDWETFADDLAISYPESSGFLIGCSGLFTVTKLRTVNRRLPAVTIPLSQSLSWRRPLTKKPEDSGYEIALSPLSLESLPTTTR